LYPKTLATVKMFGLMFSTICEGFDGCVRVFSYTIPANNSEISARSRRLAVRKWPDEQLESVFYGCVTKRVDSMNSKLVLRNVRRANETNGK
jgi:hypothetical protein